MKNTSTPSQLFPEYNQITNAINLFVSELPSCCFVKVAFSGGLDSTVLLHLLAINPNLKGRITVHYVDHGIQNDSKRWRLHCEEIANQLGIPFQNTLISIKCVKRKGVEAVARRLRYRALANTADKKAFVLVTGHHQRDQAETLLLNLVRGAGVSGLAAMPSVKGIKVNGKMVKHYRPLLQVPYKILVNYAKHFNLRWVEDESNQRLTYRRNIIRHQVLPELSKKWPQVDRALARTASNMGEAQILLNRLAVNDLQDIKESNNSLDLELLKHLDWISLKNVIRYWLTQSFGLSLSANHYDWILSVLDADGISQSNAFSYELSIGILRFYQKKLFYIVMEPHVFAYSYAEFLKIVSQVNQELINSKNTYKFNLSGCVDLENSTIKVRNIFQDDNIKRKNLKRFFQNKRIPPWDRLVWPVLVCDDRVVSVLGCDGCVISSSSEIKLKPLTHKYDKSIEISQAVIYKMMNSIL